MSIDFQISRSPQKSKGILGWRFTDDSCIDLTNWSIVYQRDRIICRPKPIELVYMIAGTVFFLALTVGLLSMVFGFRLPSLVRLDAQSESQHAIQLAGFGPLPTWQKQNRSRFQTDRPGDDDARAATQRLRQRMLEGKSEEERQAFNEAAGKISQSSPSRNTKRSDSIDRVLDVFFLLGKVVTFFIAVISTALAMACLRRAILFFTNRLEVRVANRSLYLTQPKLLGGVKKRTFSLATMGPIHCRAVHSGDAIIDGETYGSDYTTWSVLLMSRSKDMPLEFKIEQTVTGSSIRPTPKTVKFANRLKELTGLPLIG